MRSPSFVCALGTHDLARDSQFGHPTLSSVYTPEFRLKISFRFSMSAERGLPGSTGFTASKGWRSMAGDSGNAGTKVAREAANYRIRRCCCGAASRAILPFKEVKSIPAVGQIFFKVFDEIAPPPLNDLVAFTFQEFLVFCDTSRVFRIQFSV